MSAKMKLLVGLTAIDTGIKELRGVVQNVNERVQTLAVSIIAHDIAGGQDGSPTGDCSRALKLVQTLPNSFRREYLTGFFSAFGNIGIDLNKGQVRHHPEGSKRFVKPNLDGAKANNWWEAADSTGKRADWYKGPAPAPFQSNTIGDFGMGIINFGDRLLKQMEDTKDDKPVYDLTDEQREQARTAITVLKKLGTALAAREQKEQYAAQIVQLDAIIQDVAPVMALGNAPERTGEEAETVRQQAVAG